MKSLFAAAAALCLSAGLSNAQSPRQASFLGSVWGFHFYETGGPERSSMTGEPAYAYGQPNAVITVVNRDGRALTESDRDAAIRLARGLCEQSGRRFNTQTRGHWLNSGALGFQGACTQW